jgi:hypothetical protein
VSTGCHDDARLHHQTLSVQRWRFARRALADDPVFNPSEDVFDLLRTDIRVEKQNREFAVQRSVGAP